MKCITDSVHESIQLSLALREPEFHSIDDQNIQVSRVCHRLTSVGLLSRVSSLIWFTNFLYVSQLERICYESVVEKLRCLIPGLLHSPL